MNHIVTFYSYKGGVGRTFLLANVAVLLARGGLRVLIMDWDLEAPGLDRFFRGYLPRKVSPEKGVLSMLCAAGADPGADWRDHVVRVTGLKGGAELSLIPSGVAAADYAQRLHNFSWNAFFAGEVGGPVLERWRTEWKKEFDFVLVDSRTGLSDIGGVCTILLPDILAVVYTASHQSMAGVRAVIDSAQRERPLLNVPRLALGILPVPSRFDGRDEVELAEEWLTKFAEVFGPVVKAWLPGHISARDLLVKLKIPYVARFSFGEELAVETHGTTNPDYPGYSIASVAELLASSFASVSTLFPRPVISESELEESSEPHQHLNYDLRTFLSDQAESVWYFLFSLGQASVLVAIGVLAGRVIPFVHDHAATWAGLSEERLTKWDETHHSLGRSLEDTLHVCALALLCIGVVVIVLTTGHSLYRRYRKMPPPTIRSVKYFGWNSLVSAGIFSFLILVSMLLNIITAYPLALLLSRAPLTAQIGGWLLTGLEGVLLLFGLIFAFLQSARSARRFLLHVGHGQSTEVPLSATASYRKELPAPARYESSEESKHAFEPMPKSSRRGGRKGRGKSSR